MVTVLPVPGGWLADSRAGASRNLGWGHGIKTGPCRFRHDGRGFGARDAQCVTYDITSLLVRFCLSLLESELELELELKLKLELKLEFTW